MGLLRIWYTNGPQNGKKFLNKSIRFEIKESISMFCEKRKRVVSAGSELFNTHYHGIDDTPTQKAYHRLNVTPHANG